MSTLNGTTPDTSAGGAASTNAQLSIYLDGSTLSKSISGLKIATGGVANNEIASAAAIAFTKMAALTVSRALQTNASTGFVEASGVTNTELGYVSGVTSAIQTQFGGKLNLSGGTMSGAISMGTTNKITDLATPTLNYDAATKKYVDDTVS